ncbi:MerR family transcriptional regulator [Oerskovia enterophila]|uniref:MerR family transcriptional regulator n=1 Tax=Oerskovia enterophila TaxID=43678 RepID=UPI003830F46C
MMQIGELARRTGVATRLLRYYQEQDLLHPERLPNGYRDFDDGSVQRVLQIRSLLEAGLSTTAIQRLLPCFTGQGADLRAMTDPEMAANLHAELVALEERIAALVDQAEAIRRYLAQAASTTAA